LNAATGLLGYERDAPEIRTAIGPRITSENVLHGLEVVAA